MYRIALFFEECVPPTPSSPFFDSAVVMMDQFTGALVRPFTAYIYSQRKSSPQSEAMKKKKARKINVY